MDGVLKTQVILENEPLITVVGFFHKGALLDLFALCAGVFLTIKIGILWNAVAFPRILFFPFRA